MAVLPFRLRRTYNPAGLPFLCGRRASRTNNGDILELPHIARPVVAGQRPQRAPRGPRTSFLNSCESLRMKPDALKHPDNLR